MPSEINFYNPRSIVLFVSLLQGVVFAVLLGYRGVTKRVVSDIWLGLLLVVMCSGLITHFIGFANVYDNNQWLTFFPFELVFLHAPLIYLYVIALTDSTRRFRSTHLFLFVPATLNWIYFFVLFLQSERFKSRFEDSLTHAVISNALGAALLVWNAVFLYLAIRHYLRYRDWLDDNYSDTEILTFSWLRNFLYIFSALIVVESVYDVLSVFINFTYVQVFYLKLLAAFVTYYLAIAGYMRSSAVSVAFDPKEGTGEPDESDEQDLQLKSELAALMESEKPYLDPQLTLVSLARKIGTNTSRLSRVINSGFGKNFNDFINEHRIEDLKQKIEAGQDATLLTIAMKSGFNSKATFNRAFKKSTGMTPRQYAEESSASMEVS